MVMLGRRWSALVVLVSPADDYPKVGSKANSIMPDTGAIRLVRHVSSCAYQILHHESLKIEVDAQVLVYVPTNDVLCCK